MFNQYPFISPAHIIVLENIVRTHGDYGKVNPQLLGTMYRLAANALAKAPSGNDADLHVSFVTNDAGAAVASVTCTKTGLYLQLARIGLTNPFLTVGQKWVMEGANPVQGNVATMFW